MAPHDTNKRCRHTRSSSSSPSNGEPFSVANNADSSARRSAVKPRAAADNPTLSSANTRMTQAQRVREQRRRSLPTRLPVLITADLPNWTDVCPSGESSPGNGASSSWRRRPRKRAYDVEPANMKKAIAEEGIAEGEEPSDMSFSDAESEEEEEEEADGMGSPLMDLPDHAIANVFFSGFLDSIEVVSCLRLVSKHVRAIGSVSCKMLDLHGMRMNDQELAAVATAFPRVMHLDLSYCKGLGDGLGSSLKPCVDSLRTLSLRGTGASDAMVAGLRDLGQLTELDLCQSIAADSTNITPAGLEALMGLTRLEKLGLAWNKGVTDDAIEKLCGAMRGLRELDLALCSKITSRSLQALSLQSDLRILSVQACRLINDQGVEMLTSACPGLVSLDLAHLPLLRSSALKSLCLLRKLRKLDVRCCEQIPAVDVANFKAARPRTWVAELRSWWP